MGKVPPDLFRSPNTLASLRPAAIQQHVQAQQQQHNSSPTANQPALLQRLQACLADAAATPKEAVHGRHAQQQLLHAYHQVFQLFLASMTTYRPLLLQIKRVYDAAVQDATAALSDNTQLQAKLSQVPHKQVRQGRGPGTAMCTWNKGLFQAGTGLCQGSCHACKRDTTLHSRPCSSKQTENGPGAPACIHHKSPHIYTNPT